MGQVGRIENLTSKRIYSAYRVACVMLRFSFLRSIIQLSTDLSMRQITKIADLVPQKPDCAQADKVNSRKSLINNLLQTDAYQVNDYLVLYMMLHRANATTSLDVLALINAWVSVNAYRRHNRLSGACSPININHIWKLCSYLSLRCAVFNRNSGAKIKYASKLNLLYVTANANTQDVMANVPVIGVNRVLELVRKEKAEKKREIPGLAFGEHVALFQNTVRSDTVAYKVAP